MKSSNSDTKNKTTVAENYTLQQMQLFNYFHTKDLQKYINIQQYLHNKILLKNANRDECNFTGKIFFEGKEYDASLSKKYTSLVQPTPARNPVDRQRPRAPSRTRTYGRLESETLRIKLDDSTGIVQTRQFKRNENTTHTVTILTQLENSTGKILYSKEAIEIFDSKKQWLNSETVTDIPVVTAVVETPVSAESLLAFLHESKRLKAYDKNYPRDFISDNARENRAGYLERTWKGKISAGSKSIDGCFTIQNDIKGCRKKTILESAPDAAGNKVVQTKLFSSVRNGRHRVITRTEFIDSKGQRLSSAVAMNIFDKDFNWLFSEANRRPLGYAVNPQANGQDSKETTMPKITTTKEREITSISISDKERDSDSSLLDSISSFPETKGNIGMHADHHDIPTLKFLENIHSAQSSGRL